MMMMMMMMMIFTLKTRLGGETRKSDVNMHNGYGIIKILK